MLISFAVRQVPPELQRLIFQGTELMDEARPLGQYGVDDHAEIFVVRRLASSRPPRS